MSKLLEKWDPEEARKIDDPKYCLYHQNIGPPTKDCNVLKDKIQALTYAKVIKLRPEQKMVSTNVATITMGSLEILVGITPIPIGKMVVKNYDL